MESQRVCRNPACVHQGALQSIENFYKIRSRGKQTTARICRDCRLAQVRKWNAAHRVEMQEGSRRIPDNDDETDLVPMKAGGFVRWAVLTFGRRLALGEASMYNGQSVDIDMEGESMIRNEAFNDFADWWDDLFCEARPRGGEDEDESEEDDGFVDGEVGSDEEWEEEDDDGFVDVATEEGE